MTIAKGAKGKDREKTWLWVVFDNLHALGAYVGAVCLRELMQHNGPHSRWCAIKQCSTTPTAGGAA